MYPHWKWFERLVISNLSEVCHRHVAMPSDLTPASLLAILSVPLGAYQERNTIRTLSEKDVSIISNYMEQFQLSESPIFDKFAKECSKKNKTTIPEE